MKEQIDKMKETGIKEIDSAKDLRFFEWGKSKVFG